MEFYPHEPFDANSAQRYVWDSLKKAFHDDDRGVAYYRYHIFPQNRLRRAEPDILLLHPDFGLVVIECKGCKIENVEAINGSTWSMRDWHEEKEAPFEQAEDQMFAVKARYERRRDARGLLSFHCTVAVPFVHRKDWESKGFAALTGDGVLVREDLTPSAIQPSLKRLVAARPQQPLTPSQWEAAISVLRGKYPNLTPARSLPVPRMTARFGSFGRSRSN